MVYVYNLFLILITLLLSPVIIAALIIQPKFRAGFWQKTGFYKFDKNGQKTTVFHAVSVGEVNAVKELIKLYKASHPDEHLVITTTTKTGHEIAKKTFSDIADTVTYYPFDFFFSVLSFFNTFNPEKVIIAETEIWPFFVYTAKAKNIKVYTINGRISPHSFDGYKKIKWFLASFLNKYEKIFMQTKDDAQRIIALGAEYAKVDVMGNLKFDINQNLTETQIEEYRNQLKTDGKRLFIAASTHKGEDEIVLKAFCELKKNHSDAVMLIAPRHPQRYDEVIALIKNTGFNWGKRSNNDNFENKEIILLDTMGELSKLFSLCHTAFIGGSFSSTGGHNPLEANIWGKPVISGPCIFNFKDVYKIVTEKNCAVIVSDVSQLIGELNSFYSNIDKYNQFCNNAKSVFDENRGAINYLLEKI